MGYIRKSLREWFLSGLVGLALGLVVGSSATTMHDLVTYEEPIAEPVPDRKSTRLNSSHP